jgi:hypothetical protein
VWGDLGQPGQAGVANCLIVKLRNLGLERRAFLSLFRWKHACQQLDLVAIDPGVHAVAVRLDLVQPLPVGASSTRRVSCGLIHLGGRDVVPTTHFITAGRSRKSKDRMR